MIIKPTEATNMHCATNPLGFCKGERCMAWRKHLVNAPGHPPVSGFQLGPLPPQVAIVETGLGYCGMVYKG